MRAGQLQLQAESLRLLEAGSGRGGNPGGKQVIGDGLRSRTDQRRATEVDAAVRIPNRMLELGRLVPVRIA